MSQAEESGAEAGQKPKQNPADSRKRTDRSYPVYQKETAREEIETLVEGLDYGTAAKYLIQPPGDRSWPLPSEPGYALEYAEKALAEDPTSADALYVKYRLSSMEEREQYGVQFLKYESDDVRNLITVGCDLDYDYPVEVVAALAPHAENSEVWGIHGALGTAYARLGMREEAREHRRIFIESGPLSRYITFSGEEFKGEEFYGKEIDLLESWPPTIWEDWNKKAAATEAAQQQAPDSPFPAMAPGVESPKPQDTAPSHLPPDAPRGVEPPPPPPDIEAEMSAAYADFAKAYQSAFETEYGLSAATPEGYMNALLGMARAFAKAGDAKHAQDAYNAARKRYSPEEIQQAFRRFDEQDRLRRQASNEQDDGEGD